MPLDELVPELLVDPLDVVPDDGAGELVPPVPVEGVDPVPLDELVPELPVDPPDVVPDEGAGELEGVVPLDGVVPVDPPDVGVVVPGEGAGELDPPVAWPGVTGAGATAVPATVKTTALPPKVVVVVGSLDGTTDTARPHVPDHGRSNPSCTEAPEARPAGAGMISTPAASVVAVPAVDPSV